jgi:hypothetical protein
MTREELERVRKWADDKLATQQEPPWAWYQYMKLRETLDAILAAQTAITRQTADSPGSEHNRGTHLRLVGEASSQDTPQSRPEDQPVQLPM